LVRTAECWQTEPVHATRPGEHSTGTPLTLLQREILPISSNKVQCILMLLHTHKNSVSTGLEISLADKKLKYNF